MKLPKKYQMSNARKKVIRKDQRSIDNPKSFNAYVKSKCISKARTGPLQDRQGQIVDDNKGMRQILIEV